MSDFKMKKRFLSYVSYAFSFFVLCAGVSHALAQTAPPSFPPPPIPPMMELVIVPDSIGPNDAFWLGHATKALTQSFQSPITGSITSLAVGLSKFRDPNVPINVNITSSLNPSIIINQATIKPGSVTSFSYLNPTWVSVTFSSPISVVKGATYYLTLSVSSADRLNFYKWSTNNTNPYSQGVFYRGSAARAQSDALAKIQIQGEGGISIPVYEAEPSGTLVQNQSYTFKGSVRNALPNKPVYFYLQRPDGTMKYDERNDILAKAENRSTDSAGYFSISALQQIPNEGQTGTYTSWVTVGGVTSNKIYHKVISGSAALPVTITSPNGREVWQINSLHTIQWIPYDPQKGVNVVPNVSAYLEKLVNGSFVTVGKIIEAGKASIHWIGELDTYGKYADPGDYFIRIINNQTGQYDRSDASFKLVPQGTVKADLKINGSDGPIALPSGGGKVTFSWTSQNANTCKLYLNGLGDDLTGLPSSGQRDLFLKQNPFPGQLAMAIICESSIGGASDDVFILPYSEKGSYVKVTSPNGGENLSLSASHPINWVFSPDITRVSIALYKNDAFFKWIAADLPWAGPGVLSWIPSSTVSNSDIGGQVFKIYMIGYKSSGGTVEDKSDAPFSIIDLPSQSITAITVLAPNGGETWQAGSMYRVSWKYAAPFSKKGSINVEIWKGSQFVQSGGVAADDIYSVTSYDYKLPNDLSPGSDYKIKVSDSNNAVNVDSSDAPFSIVQGTQPAISVITPNGGESWQMGSTQTIKWSSSNVPTVMVDLIRPGYECHLTDGDISNAGFLTFTVSSCVNGLSISSATDYKIRIMYRSNAVVIAQDESDASFSIISSTVIPTLHVALDASSPSGATFTAGTINVTFVRIKVSAGTEAVNNMNAIQVGSDSWNAAKTLSNFKVYDGATLLSSSSLDLDYNGSYYYQWLKVSGFSVPANTSKVLTVVADVKLTAPSGNVRLGIAGWNFDAPGAHVEPFGTPLYGNQMVITAPIFYSGFFMKPDKSLYSVNDIVLLTLSRSDNRTEPYATDLYVMKVDGSNKVLISPNLSVGQNTIAKIQLNQWPLFTQGGAGQYLLAICPAGCAYGSDQNTNTVVIELSGVTVIPSVTIRSPNGGEIWQKGQTYPIKWNSSGFPLNGWIQIQLRDAANPSLIVRRIALSNFLSVGSYNWTIPTDLTSGKYLIWVTVGSVSIPDKATDYSDAPFSIVTTRADPSAMITSPLNNASIYAAIQLQLDEIGRILQLLR